MKDSENSESFRCKEFHICSKCISSILRLFKTIYDQWLVAYKGFQNDCVFHNQPLLPTCCNRPKNMCSVVCYWLVSTTTGSPSYTS